MKSTLKPKKYITNRRGKKVGVVLDIEDYKKMLADIEERALGDAVNSLRRATRTTELRSPLVRVAVLAEQNAQRPVIDDDMVQRLVIQGLAGVHRRHLRQGRRQPISPTLCHPVHVG